MKLIKVLTKIINEARTETDPLWFRVPSKAVDEMGIKLYFDSDDAYVVEVQFDTQMVVIQLFTKDPETNETIPYSDSRLIPGNFKEYYLIPLNKIPRSLKAYILRRLDTDYLYNL